MEDEEKSSTLAVSDEIRLRVKEAAREARLSMYEYANVALDFAMGAMHVQIQVESNHGRS